MAVADARGIVKETELFKTMVRTAREIKPRWIALDTVADIFIVNERDRSQVRQCISLCRGVCLDIETAIILLAHPSLTGISSGTGLSGSTAWNNSVRSRLYLKTDQPKKEDTEEEEEQEADAGLPRILETMKSNYSAIGAPIRLLWKDGLFIPEPTLAVLSPLDRSALEDHARDVFLLLLDRFNRQDIAVSYKERANNFAPNEFAKQPEAKELHKSSAQRKKLLRLAMDYLLAKERIHTGRGPKSAAPSKQTECLYRGGTLL
jgi:RecA-family ATPase